jgi:hypothetical protein
MGVNERARLSTAWVGLCLADDSVSSKPAHQGGRFGEGPCSSESLSPKPLAITPLRKAEASAWNRTSALSSDRFGRAAGLAPTPCPPLPTWFKGGQKRCSAVAARPGVRDAADAAAGHGGGGAGTAGEATRQPAALVGRRPQPVSAGTRGVLAAAVAEHTSPDPLGAGRGGWTELVGRKPDVSRSSRHHDWAVAGPGRNASRCGC